MRVLVSIMVWSDEYEVLAQRKLEVSELENAGDIANVSYDVGRMVGTLLNTIAKQLDFHVGEDVSEIPLEGVTSD